MCIRDRIDVLIVGAGISGIGAGYYLKNKCPNKSFKILESRNNLGGTWDLFKYPGIRSDSAQKKIKKSEPLTNGNSETIVISSKNWTNEVSKMSISGAVKQLASNCFFDRIDNHILYLKIHSQNEHQMIDRAVDGLNSFLINQYEEVNKVIIQVEEKNGKTLAGEEKIKNEEQIIMNESRASSDPLVQEYVDLFDATIEETK